MNKTIVIDAKWLNKTTKNTVEEIIKLRNEMNKQQDKRDRETSQFMIDFLAGKLNAFNQITDNRKDEINE